MCYIFSSHLEWQIFGQSLFGFCLLFNKVTGQVSRFSHLFVLRFYGPDNPVGSCRARSVYLTTPLLGRLSPLSG